MFKKTYLTSVLLMAMLILGACGTATQQEGSTGTTPSVSEPTEDVESNEVEDHEPEEDDTTELEETEDEPIQEPEEDDSEIEENETSTENHADEQAEDEILANAEQVDSDAQDYSIQVLPDYTLTSEEPGRDSLFLTEDGNVFMRIETMPFNQEDYDYFKENTMALLESTKAEGETVSESTSLPNDESINNPIGYTVKTDESVLTGFVFEKDDLLVRLTMFDTLDEKHFNDFLHMGETITSN